MRLKIKVSQVPEDAVGGSTTEAVDEAVAEAEAVAAAAAGATAVAEATNGLSDRIGSERMESAGLDS